MQVQRKMIGGQECYEIVEAFHHRGKVEYRSVVPLGTDPDPEESLRKHQESLIDVTRALIAYRRCRTPTPPSRANAIRSRPASKMNRNALAF